MIPGLAYNWLAIATIIDHQVMLYSSFRTSVHFIGRFLVTDHRIISSRRQTTGSTTWELKRILSPVKSIHWRVEEDSSPVHNVGAASLSHHN